MTIIAVFLEVEVYGSNILIEFVALSNSAVFLVVS